MKTGKKEIVVNINGLSKIYATSKSGGYTALDNVDLKIYKGDRIGIVGNNGAGKTTLLKIISGSIKPTSGTVSTKARIVSLIDLEAGFEPELSGRENIMVNGLIIGMTKKEVQQKMQSIIDFADIGEYVNEPFYTYSAGMKFRLACAVAINSKADVLLFDEILINGDWNFQKKIFSTLAKTFKDKELTTIICSHVPELLWALSSKYFLMNRGAIRQIYKNKVKDMVLSRHTQFHKAFRTNEIPEFATDRRSKKS